MTIKTNINIKNYSTFRIDTRADILCFPRTQEEFALYFSKMPDAPVLGSASNVLMSSSGVEKAIFTKYLNSMDLKCKLLYLGAGVKMASAAYYVESYGLSGLEFLVGFPASLGGACYTNASAMGSSISDRFVYAHVFDGKKVIKLNKEEMKFSYRHSILKEEKLILLDAKFKLKKMDNLLIKKKMTEAINWRRAHQPALSKLPNAGSFFQNPPNDSAGRLLDLCGFKGQKQGGAMVYKDHANFIVNYNNATSLDVSRLAFKMYNKVKENFNIELKSEVIFVGKKTDEEEEIWKILQPS